MNFPVHIATAMSGVSAMPLWSVRCVSRGGGPVEQRLSLVTLGVADLDRALEFYKQLGWRGQQVEENVFFRAGTISIVLWGRDKLAEGSGVDDARVDGFGGIALAHNVRSKAEVDTVVTAAAEAGPQSHAGPARPSTADTRNVSPIPTDTCGRSPTTRASL